nr:meiotic nuclear division protein 1 homolog [Tanacetum cinerariifolium]
MRLESELQSSNKRHIELVEQCESLRKGREDSRKLLKLPIKPLTDGQTISSQCVSGAQTISLRPKNSLNTCTMRFITAAEIYYILVKIRVEVKFGKCIVRVSRRAGSIQVGKYAECLMLLVKCCQAKLMLLDNAAEAS